MSAVVKRRMHNFEVGQSPASAIDICILSTADMCLVSAADVSLSQGDSAAPQLADRFVSSFETGEMSAAETRQTCALDSGRVGPVALGKSLHQCLRDLRERCAGEKPSRANHMF